MCKGDTHMRNIMKLRVVEQADIQDIKDFIETQELTEIQQAILWLKIPSEEEFDTLFDAMEKKYDCSKYYVKYFESTDTVRPIYIKNPTPELDYEEDNEEDNYIY